MLIRPATVTDAESITNIYNRYILHDIATFEEEPIAVLEMGNRIASVIDGGLPWLVLEQEGLIIGYAYAAPWKVRSAYRFTVESSIYMAHDYCGRGEGKKLYQTLLDKLKALGTVHSVIGGAAMPNPASEKLHESLGFEFIGEFKETGFKFEQWINVAYWQLRIEK